MIELSEDEGEGSMDTTLAPLVKRQQTLHTDAADTTGPTSLTFDIDGLSCLSWTRKQVSDWLTQHKLGKYVER